MVQTSTTGAATVNGSTLKADRKGNRGNENSFSVTVDNSTDDGDGKSITLNHTLVNDMTNDWFDYVPYTVVVRATMTITDSAGNTSTMVKDITFKQFPAMYVYADTNESFDTDNENDDTAYTKNNDPRNTFVNGWYSVNSNHSVNSEVTNRPTRIGNVNGLQLSTNANPNQYVLTVSSFASISNMLLLTLVVILRCKWSWD